MTDATELDIDAVRARVEGATEGPWRSAEQTHGQWYGIQSEWHALGSAFHPADAEFIAQARTDLPAALDEITRLRAALDEARADVERLTDKVTEYADLVPRALRGRLDEHADDCPVCDHAAWAQLDELCSEEMARADAAESALAAVREVFRDFYLPGGPTKSEVLTRIRAILATPTTTEGSEG